MVTKITRRPRTSTAPARRTISAGTSIAASAKRRDAAVRRPVMGASALKLTPQQRVFASTLQANAKKIMGATNTSNIMAKPDFVELIPLFVQKLLITDVYGSVAMKSRHQIIPYFKVVAETTKGETNRGDIMNSPFVNRQGMDMNYAGRTIKNEAVAANTLAYLPVLPGSVTLAVTAAGGTVTKYVDNGAGQFVDASGAVQQGMAINYATGILTGVTGTIAATYQYDNETVGPDANGNYGAKMGKVYLQLDEIDLKAEAQELACYWSVYSAFAAQNEYGANIGDMAKEAAISELTAEINSKGFFKLFEAAAYKPQFDWDASPILSGAVVPSDYLNMFKLKLGQAAAAIYQATRLTRPNRLIVGTNVAEYIQMMNGFNSANIDDTVGPYKLGTLDKFEVYVDPNYDPNVWVMSCKSQDIRRNSALFGEYMPIASTDAIGLADASVQQGVCSMYAMEITNPLTIVSGRILGTF